MPTDDPPAPRPHPRASRFFLIGLGLTLACIGAMFCFWMGRAYLRLRKMDAWPATRCLILHAQVVPFQPVPRVAPRYKIDVDYVYTHAGRTYHGDRVRTRPRTTTDRTKAEGWRDPYPSGSETVCYVNPDDPAYAILEKDSKAVGYTIWFPALFVVGGLGIAAQALRRSAHQSTGL